MRRYIGALILGLVCSTGVQTAWAMGNHSDVVRDQYGRALGGATITVYVAGTTDLAEIYSDNGVTTKTNPLTSDTLDGRFNFYAANGVYDIVISHPNATFNAAHTARISVIDASNVGVGGGSPTPVGLDEVFDVGAEINSATSANPMRVGNGTQKVEIFGDPAMGGTIRPSPLGDSVWRIWTNFEACIRDEEAALSMYCINPDAPTKREMYLYKNPAYYPVASIPVTFYPMGAASYSETAPLTTQPKGGWIQVTDSDLDAVGFRTVVTGKFVGVTTATLRVYAVSDNASPSGNIVLNCDLRSNRPGTDTYATITANSSDPSLTLTPATQYRPVSAVTSAITISGTVAEFSELEGQCNVNATSTTSAQLTDFFIRADGLLQLSQIAGSD